MDKQKSIKKKNIRLQIFHYCVFAVLTSFKHILQYTGLTPSGLKGTLICLWHFEHSASYKYTGLRLELV